MSTSQTTKKDEAPWPFSHMVSMPWPYLVIIPIAFAFLVGFGWTRDDFVEDEVREIWIPTDGAFSKNLDYADSLGKERLPYTSFLAMAIARDGNNLFTAPRLEEVRQRMEKAEGTTVRSKIIVVAGLSYSPVFSFCLCFRLNTKVTKSPGKIFVFETTSEEALHTRYVESINQSKSWISTLLSSLLTRTIISRSFFSVSLR